MPRPSRHFGECSPQATNPSARNRRRRHPAARSSSGAVLGPGCHPGALCGASLHPHPRRAAGVVQAAGGSHFQRSCSGSQPLHRLRRRLWRYPARLSRRRICQDRPEWCDSTPPGSQHQRSPRCWNGCICRGWCHHSSRWVHRHKGASVGCTNLTTHARCGHQCSHSGNRRRTLTTSNGSHYPPMGRRSLLRPICNYLRQATSPRSYTVSWVRRRMCIGGSSSLRRRLSNSLNGSSSLQTSRL